jgi:SAM-dependent methyltransferase
MDQFLRRLAARLEPILLSDDAFIEQAYRQVLGRVPDEGGMTHYRSVLRGGLSRTAVILEMVHSEEFTSKLAKGSFALPSLRKEHPDRYRHEVDRTNGNTVPVFDVRSPADYDWLEEAILQNHYYEQPGVWTLGVDVDKKVIAEIIASFGPQRPIEIGCAAGAVLECLQDEGIVGEGVEISTMAIARATPRVRPHIHAGDLLDLDLGSHYDLAFGLDIFEHLNPNRLDAYIARLARITRPDGHLFVNVPAFGSDPIFGTVFPLYFDSWMHEAAKGLPFSTVHVDDKGYPIHGHLVWADSAWWVRRFEAQGFVRDGEIERELHRKYGAYMENRSPARRAFYVFGKSAEDPGRPGILERIRRPSAALA